MSRTAQTPGAEVVEYHRQLDFFNPERDLQAPLTLIGCGGIGSPTAMALTKMGIKDLTLIDDDFVEPHNLPNQLFPLAALGQPKVTALAQVCHDFSGYRPNTRQERFEGGALAGVVISGVDSMAARQQIWNSVRMRSEISLYIEARMGGQVARIYTVDPADPDQVAAYERTLYTDDQASEEPCTARAIAYNVFAIAGLIASQVKKFAKEEPLQGELILDLQNAVLVS